MTQGTLPGFPAHTLPSRFPAFPALSTACAASGFLAFCLMVVVPLAMAFILGGQIGDYFTTDPETQGQTVYYIGYGIGAAIVVLAWIAAFTSPKRKK